MTSPTSSSSKPAGAGGGVPSSVDRRDADATGGHGGGGAIIRLVDVHKRFGPLVVLDGLSLDVREHETLVVLGPSGTGKSVLLKHIIGLLRPERGAVYFRDTRIDVLKERELEPIRRRFGFLFQQGALFDSMSVADNIAFPLRQQDHRAESDIRQIVAQKLAMVGLEGTEKKMPGDLSGGQKKRVALARAIALDPGGGVVRRADDGAGPDPGGCDQRVDLEVDGRAEGDEHRGDARHDERL